MLGYAMLSQRRETYMWLTFKSDRRKSAFQSTELATALHTCLSSARVFLQHLIFQKLCLPMAV